MSVFDKRTAFKPFEYPWAVEFKKKIHSAFWTVDHFTFDSDIDDYKTRLTAVEREAVRRAMLAIAQVEVKVKEFWAKLYDRFPKPEFHQVGSSFSDSEVRHEDAYSELLELLGLNEDFDELEKVPAIKGRVDYLTKHLSAGSGPEGHTLAVVLFSLLVENVSLFGQFAVMKSVNRHRDGLLKGIDNVVQATQQEEQLHALFGIRLVNTVREEYPRLFGPGLYERLSAVCEKAIAAESNIVDWIYEKGELPYLTAATLKEFLKDRVNQGVTMVGGRPPFAVDKAVLEPVRWFSEELLARINPDFFNKRPVSYSRFGEPITADNLF